DVAPTVLDLLALPVPTSMEGRPMRIDAGHGSAADRRSMLERANTDGLLRDDLVNPVTAAVLWTAIVLSIASALVLVLSRPLLERFPSTRVLLQWVALALVGFVLATLPATLFRFGDHGGIAAYWLFLSLFAVAFAAVCRVVGRRRPLDPIIWALVALLAVVVLDQFTGCQMECNSVFGYSATVGIRFSGIGNQSSALLATAA